MCATNLNAPTPKRQVTPLDSLIILVMSCTITLFLLWLVGAVMHNPIIDQLPDFVQKAYHSIWSYVTGAGATGILAFLKKDQPNRPNYLVWSFGTTVSLLLVVILFARAIPPPPLPQQVWLKLWMKFNWPSKSLSVIQKYPKFLDARPLAPDPNDGHYQELFDWPKPNQHLEVSAEPIVLTAEQADGPSKPLDFCFVANPKPPTNQPPFEVQIECTGQNQCDFRPKDFGWAVRCPTESPKTGLSGPESLVYAASEPDSESKPGWKVPSLDTLTKTNEETRPGFTRFTVKAGSLPDLARATSFRYEIVANGSPLYIDGWPPENMRKTFSGDKGLDFSFAIENLDFSGMDNGCENIQLKFDFLDGDSPVKTVQLKRRYAALRDPVEETIRAEDGSRFSWSGQYIKPKRQDNSEVFALSTPDLNEAAGLKHRIDQAGQLFLGMQAVGVLRPPLNTKVFGVVIGFRQATGQVKFTFDPNTAAKIKAWAHNLHLTTPRLFPRDPFTYQTRPGDAGTGTLASCGTPQS